MKTVLISMLLAIFFLAANAECQEAPKAKVAVVNIQRLMNSGVNYDKIRLLSLDKTTLEALKKINAEIQEVQTQIVDVNDEGKLGELGRRLAFLNQKSNLLRQRAMNGDVGRDIQATLRKFVIERFKGKYDLILQQQEMGGPDRDRVLWKGETEVRDITEDAMDEFQKYLDELVGDTGPDHHRKPLIKK
jgi:hypothetical protein